MKRPEQPTHLFYELAPDSQAHEICCTVSADCTFADPEKSQSQQKPEKIAIGNYARHDTR
jgi:hypothetical protein